MRLTAEQISILRKVRNELSEQQYNWYICIAIQKAIKLEESKELSKWYNKLFFWRGYAIREKWFAVQFPLTSTISARLQSTLSASTVGTWFENVTQDVGLNLPDNIRNNGALYQQIRLAWLDRILEDGEI